MVWGPGIRTPVKTDRCRCGLCLAPGLLLLSTPGVGKSEILPVLQVSDFPVYQALLRIWVQVVGEA